jgi:hypothetical protein
VTEHDECRDLLAMRRELSVDDEERLTTHMHVCRECRELAAEYAWQDAFLESLLLPALPQTFEAGVLGGVQSRRVPHHLPLWRHGLGMFSAAAVILVIVLTAAQVSTAGTPQGAAAGERAVLQSGVNFADPYAVNSAGRPIPTPRAHADGPAIVYGPSRKVNGKDQLGAFDGAVSSPATGSASTSESVPWVQAAPNNGPMINGPFLPRVQSISHGLLLTLTLEDADVAQGSVVPVDIEIRSLTPGVIQIAGGPRIVGCPLPAPGVESVDAQGHPVAPLPPVPSLACNDGSFSQGSGAYLRYGDVVKLRAHTVLMTDRMRTAVEVDEFGRCDPRRTDDCPVHRVHITGADLSLHLTSRPAPRPTVYGFPPTAVTIPAPAGVPHTLWMAGWFECTRAAGPVTTEQGPIVPGGEAVQRSNTVQLPIGGCSRRSLRIHALFGWIGSPVARLDYGK